MTTYPEETREALGDYSSAQRTLQGAGIMVFGALAVHLSMRLIAIDHPLQTWLIGGAAVAGYVMADFVSGFVHWACDTWGSTQMPLLGRSIIRPFREHHWDQLAITRHDFIETNGNNCCVSIPVLAVACFIPITTGVGVFVKAFLLFLSLAVFATNQFHKWAHVDDPGTFIRRLQRWHLILPADHHQVHHVAPYETHYCITTGWFNPLLHATGFYPRLERVITAITGIEPRRD